MMVRRPRRNSDSRLFDAHRRTCAAGLLRGARQGRRFPHHHAGRPEGSALQIQARRHPSRTDVRSPDPADGLCGLAGLARQMGQVCHPGAVLAGCHRDRAATLRAPSQRRRRHRSPTVGDGAGAEALVRSCAGTPWTDADVGGERKPAASTVSAAEVRPLVMRCGAFGDIVLLTVLLQQLHRRFGKPVDVIASGPWTEPLLESESAVGELFILRSRRTPYWLSAQQQRLIAWLRRRGSGPTWFCDRGERAADCCLAQAFLLTTSATRTHTRGCRRRHSPIATCVSAALPRMRLGGVFRLPNREFRRRHISTSRPPRSASWSRGSRSVGLPVVSTSSCIPVAATSPGARFVPVRAPPNTGPRSTGPRS